MKTRNLALTSGIVALVASGCLIFLNLLMPAMPYEFLELTALLSTLYRYGLLIFGLAALGLGIASQIYYKGLRRPGLNPALWLIILGGVSTALFLNALIAGTLTGMPLFRLWQNLLSILHTGVMVLFLLVGLVFLQQVKQGHFAGQVAAPGQPVAPAADPLPGANRLLVRFVGILGLVTGGGILLFGLATSLPVPISEFYFYLLTMLDQFLSLEAVLLFLGIFLAIQAKGDQRLSKAPSILVIIGAGLATFAYVVVYQLNMAGFLYYSSSIDFDPLTLLPLFLKLLAVIGGILTLIAGILYLQQLKKLR